MTYQLLFYTREKKNKAQSLWIHHIHKYFAILQILNDFFLENKIKKVLKYHFI